MKINQKKSSSKFSATHKTTPSRETKSAEKKKRSSPDEAADSLAQPVHPASPAPGATPPTPPSTSTLASGTPRASIIERVRLEALHARSQEVVSALLLVSRSARRCHDDAQSWQNSHLVGPHLSIESRKQPVIISQDSACDLIRSAMSTAAKHSNALQPAVLAFATRMVPNAQLDRREGLSADIQTAKTQLTGYKEQLESLIQNDLNEPMRPMLEQCTSITLAAQKAFDDAFDLVRESRVLHLTAAKYV